MRRQRWNAHRATVQDVQQQAPNEIQDNDGDDKDKADECKVESLLESANALHGALTEEERAEQQRQWDGNTYIRSLRRTGRHHDLHHRY